MKKTIHTFKIIKEIKEKRYCDESNESLWEKNEQIRNRTKRNLWKLRDLKE